MRANGTESAVVDALVAGSRSVRSLPDAELLAAVDELAARRRALDAALVEAAGEIAARSEHLPADESLARRAGHRGAVNVLHQALGTRFGDARALCAVADATRERHSLTGAVIAVPHPFVAEAVADATISVPQAQAIVQGLDRASGADHDDVLRAEVELVAAARGRAPEDETPARPEQLCAYAAIWVAHLNPDGAAPREERQRAERSFTFSRRRDGSYVGAMVCTPEQGETVLTLLDAYDAPRRAWRRSLDEAGSGDVGEGDVDGPDGAAGAHGAPADDRTVEQRRIDTIMSILAAHAATAAPRQGGDAPTLVVTTTQEALLGRDVEHGDFEPRDVAHLQRSGEPAPATLVARILCDGIVQPLLLDEAGDPLRLGRRRRLFSTAQRRAIAARDRHCRAPGCTAPPGWCEAHHVVPWSEGGRTDVEDGMLLCSHHHHEVHRGALVVELRPPAPSDVSDVGAGSGSGAQRGIGRWRVHAVHPPRARAPRRRATTPWAG